MYHNEVVGFDVRELWLDDDYRWTPARREERLIRTDIRKPISVDGFVWYDAPSESYLDSIWQDVPRKKQFLEDKWLPLFTANRLLPEIGDHLLYVRHSWNNLTTLYAFLNQHWGKAWKPCAIIGVFEVYDESEFVEHEYPSIHPKVIGDDWRLLGYDVADYELYTGLCDGKLDPAQAPQLRAKWTPHLNQYHLFDDVEKAFEFIPVADKENSSHAPYGVYAIYLIEEVNSNFF